jgi:cysteine desulfurase family protein (TIGR01976 family)
MSFDVNRQRSQFPALQQMVEGGGVPVFFDNPAGTQVPQRVIDAYRDYFTTSNANSGGFFATSQRSDAMTEDVRAKMAAFINAPDPNEIAFGPNMTTHNFNLSRSLAQIMRPGDEIVLTRMDHDANVAPWMLIARDEGFNVRWVDILEEDCTLDMDSLEAALSDRTRVVATVHASNAVGTINPVQQIAEMAHAAGAYYVIDAVQSAPHIPIDVQAINCDFLLCSAYKFFGPHMGVLWGKYDAMADLPVYKVRPAKDKPPHRWETGTNSYEGIAAVGASLDYLHDIGETAGASYEASVPVELTGMNRTFKLAMEAVRHYERELVTHLLDVLEPVSGLTVYGITDRSKMVNRVPTVVFTLDGHTPDEIAAALASKHIYVWSGHYYAVEIMERLGQGEHGMVRVGLAHYNTVEEIDRLGDAIKSL